MIALFRNQLLLTSMILTSLAAPAMAHPEKGSSKAEAELKALSEKMMNSWASADEPTFRAALAETIWGAWDLDMAGRPASLGTKADVMKFFDAMTKGLVAAGGSLKVSITNNDCHASGDLGVCLLVGDGTLTMPNMPPMSLGQFRNTEVFKREKSGWKIVHHHGSVGQLPDMPANFMAMTAKTAKYMPVPGMPGHLMAPIWMNPITQQSVAIMKIGKDGLKQGRHMHPYAYALTVLEGGITTTDSNGKEREFGPGSVLYRAPREVHTTTIKPNSAVFMITDGPMEMLDEKGAPQAPPTGK